MRQTLDVSFLTLASYLLRLEVSRVALRRRSNYVESAYNGVRRKSDRLVGTRKQLFLENEALVVVLEAAS